MGVLSKLFGTHSERELKRIKPLVDKIEALKPAMQQLSDEDKAEIIRISKDFIQRAGLK